MKKLLILFFVVVLIFSTKMLSANSQASDSINPVIKPYELAIYIVPSSFLDANPRFRAGAKMMSIPAMPKLGFSIDLGFGAEAFKAFSINDDIKPKYRLFEIRPEISYHFNPQYSNYFVSIEYFYIHHSSQWKDGYYHDFSNNTKYYFSLADFSRIKQGFHFKAGLAGFSFSRAYLDLYTGIGIAFREIDYQNPLITKTAEFYPPMLTKRKAYHIKGKDTFFNMALGMKIGFKSR